MADEPEVQYPIADDQQAAPQPPINEPVQPPAAVEAGAAQGDPNGPDLEQLREELRQLRQSVDEVSQASVESLRRRMLLYTARPLTDFNNYEALEMLDSLQSTAKDKAHEKRDYYRVAYQTAREKVNLPAPQFQMLIRRLLGDKDHDKVLDIVAKVEKTLRKEQSRRPTPTWFSYRERGRSTRASPAPRCYFCHKPGHFKADCNEFRRSTQARQAKNPSGETRKAQ
ncbi:uncharacterized protein LOC114540259 [Dendronephthya gigantea]|uniref:uncharacterized protein LOC114528815 n=1 Tax=Dendronephthya gigantea TaxID=151771 RepID=UPI00106ABBC7|nr:uncharacterized protein LOC114528815 [Dendronephthya gigantea]XP_028412482.1 uncharacterized protein LOC114535316 [Dendronephthya gigantea]XP_028415780.1 uncharacterized protein LOC114539349 [Dendronephthya gigantea]XP_028416341.1 uncharacterized protein LOC114540259 [Dendronephthya gigantea]